MRPAKSNTQAKLLGKVTTEDPELADRFNRVLGKTVEAMEESGLRYVFIGGIASGGLGRPRSTHDIDLFVKPEDAQLVLQALAKHGFRTEKTDPSWLYKGFKEDILVDVIFKSKGEIYLDTEMYQRSIEAEFHGKRLRLVAPEDLLIIKAAAHSELTPGHWHDATALLSHANLDWDYLIRRARRAPRRVLSLLLYAQSNDIWVPNFVINELYQGIFGDAARQIAPMQGQGLSQQRPGMNASASPGPDARGGTSLSLVSGAPSMSGIAYDQRGVEVLRKKPSEQAAAAWEQGTASVREGERESCAIGRTPGRLRDVYAIGHLRECLAEDPRTNELDIEIEQANDRILLRGEVSVFERKEAVERIARECFPQFQIENQIRVMNFNEPTETEEVK